MDHHYIRSSEIIPSPRATETAKRLSASLDLRPKLMTGERFYIQFSATCVLDNGAEETMDALLGYNDDAVFELGHARPFNTEGAAISRVKHLRAERRLYKNPCIRTASQVSVKTPAANPILIV